MVNRPDWQSIDLPAPGKLISNGVLNPLYASTLQFGSNDGAGTCRAYQEAAAYRLSTSKSNESAWIRWKINFDEVDYIDVKSQREPGSNTLEFRISDSEYDPSVASFSSWYYDKDTIWSRGINLREQTIEVPQYTGVHWMYIHTGSPYFTGGWSLLDIELRK